jgi:hypothetical protein
MVYHHSGQLKVQNRNWNLTLSVFWKMKIRRTPTPVSDAIAPPPSLRLSGCCPSGCTAITPLLSAPLGMRVTAVTVPE